MPDHTPSYEDTLTAQLQQRHASLLATAENDIALLRARFAIVTTFIHDPTHDQTAREALARALGLPTPENTR